MQVRSPSWHSGLRIQCCQSCGLGCNCGLDLIPGQGTPHATGQPKRKRKRKKKKKKQGYAKGNSKKINWVPLTRCVTLRIHLTSCDDLLPSLANDDHYGCFQLRSLVKNIPNLLPRSEPNPRCPGHSPAPTWPRLPPSLTDNACPNYSELFVMQHR